VGKFKNAKLNSNNIKSQQY